jgi:hypothetical protein
MVKDILYYIFFCIGGHWEAWKEGCLEDIKYPPHFNFFKQWGTQKNTSQVPQNVNDSIGENLISYFKN